MGNQDYYKFEADLIAFVKSDSAVPGRLAEYIQSLADTDRVRDLAAALGYNGVIPK